MKVQTKRIYIADDDDNIRQALRIFLENEGYCVEAFETGDLLFQRFQEDACDLIILDIMLPGTSGFDICRKIREESTVPIIMLTARDSDLDYAMGIGLGSDDYFTKPFSAMMLVMRVKSIFRRIEYESRKNNSTADSGDVLRAGRLCLEAKSHRVLCGGEEIHFTPNEYMLLYYLMQHKGEAVPREELLKYVWGYQTEAETRATDDTVRRLRKKLNGSGVVVEAVWGIGFRLVEGEIKR